MQVSSPKRKLVPDFTADDLESESRDHGEEDQDHEEDDDERELSPEKDYALQTLDNVIQEAEESMGK